jgi:hypothetical protein
MKNGAQCGRRAFYEAIQIASGKLAAVR